MLRTQANPSPCLSYVSLPFLASLRTNQPAVFLQTTKNPWSVVITTSGLPQGNTILKIGKINACITKRENQVKQIKYYVG